MKAIGKVLGVLAALVAVGALVAHEAPRVTRYGR